MVFSPSEYFDILNMATMPPTPPAVSEAEKKRLAKRAKNARLLAIEKQWWQTCAKAKDDKILAETLAKNKHDFEVRLMQEHAAKKAEEERRIVMGANLDKMTKEIAEEKRQLVLKEARQAALILEMNPTEPEDGLAMERRLRAARAEMEAETRAEFKRFIEAEEDRVEEMMDLTN